MNLISLLKGKPPPAETLRQALAEAESEAAAVEQEMAALRDQRQALLLNGMDDAKLDEAEAALNRCYRRQDRADLLGAQLKERLEQAVAAEHLAEAEQIRKDGEAAQDRGAKLLERYGDLSRQLLEVVEGLAHAEAEIRAANVRMHGRRDPGPALRGVEAAFWSGREAIQQFPPWSILDVLRLPSPDQPRSLVWPRANLT